MMTKREGRDRAKMVGYTYGGFADGFHIFHKRGRDGGFVNVLATDDDMTNGNFEWLIVNGFTRTEDDSADVTSA